MKLKLAYYKPLSTTTVVIKRRGIAVPDLTAETNQQYILVGQMAWQLKLYARTSLQHPSV